MAEISENYVITGSEKMQGIEIGTDKTTTMDVKKDKIDVLFFIYDEQGESNEYDNFRQWFTPQSIGKDDSITLKKGDKTYTVKNVSQLKTIIVAKKGVAESGQQFDIKKLKNWLMITLHKLVKLKPLNLFGQNLQIK